MRQGHCGLTPAHEPPRLSTHPMGLRSRGTPRSTCPGPPSPSLHRQSVCLLTPTDLAPSLRPMSTGSRDRPQRQGSVLAASARQVLNTITHDAPSHASVCYHAHRSMQPSDVFSDTVRDTCPPRPAHLTLHFDGWTVRITRDGTRLVPNDTEAKGDNDHRLFKKTIVEVAVNLQDVLRQIAQHREHQNKFTLWSEIGVE